MPDLVDPIRQALDTIESLVPQILAQLNATQSAIDRVPALHFETTDCPSGQPHGCTNCVDLQGYCHECRGRWPCGTVEALDRGEGAAP